MTKACLIGLSLMCAMCWLAAQAAEDHSINWCTTYVSSALDGLHRISISSDPKTNQIKIHAWAKAFPDDIDWGETPAEVYQDSSKMLPCFVGHFSVGTLKAMLVLQPNSGGGKPHYGGLVIGTLFQKYCDGRPLKYEIQQFNTETK